MGVCMVTVWCRAGDGVPSVGRPVVARPALCQFSLAGSAYWRAMPEEKPKLEIDWVKTLAGALAAVSSAVLLSTLGAAGTLICAALGSITLTVTSAFYSQGLAQRDRQRVVEGKSGSGRLDLGCRLIIK